MFDGYVNQPQATTPPPPPPQKVMRCDRGYATTMPGMLKVVQLLTNLISFICIKISWNAWISAIFYNILYWVGIICSGFLLLAYTLHIVEKFDRWPWLKLEMFYCGGFCIAYVFFSIIATTIGESVGFVVGFFGLVAIVAYGFDGYLKYKAWKRGLPAQ